MSTQSVIVVGAGVAGLAGAHALRKAGYQVVVLEARDRVGGRLHAARLGDQFVDSGAQWLEGERGNPITQLCHEHGVRHMPTSYSYKLFDANGMKVKTKKAAKIEKVTAKLLRKTRKLDRVRRAKGQPDVSLEQALAELSFGDSLTDREWRLARWSLSAEIEADEADDLSNLSLRGYWYDDDTPDTNDIDGADRVFPDGYGQLPQALAKGLDIRLNHRVDHIEYGEYGVRVTTQDYVFTADKVLVTLPVGVLQARSVTFSPKLPKAKREAINSIGCGIANKVILRFAAPFWNLDTEYFGFASTEPGRFPVWTNMHAYTGKPILSLWSHGNFAREFEERSDLEAVNDALKALCAVFGKAVTDPTDYLVTRWGKDPFARCAYSNLPVGSTPKLFKTLAQPIDGKVFFAGEATSEAHHATVHGAYLSGLHAAELIQK